MDTINRKKYQLKSFITILLELSSASLRNWNVGILKYWNDGVASFGQINACGGDGWDQSFSASFSLTTNA
jgi:hypothetical protein